MTVGVDGPRLSFHLTQTRRRLQTARTAKTPRSGLHIGHLLATTSWRRPRRQHTVEALLHSFHLCRATHRYAP